MDGADDIVALISPPAGMTPCGIHLAAALDFREGALDLRVEAPALVSWDTIRVGTLEIDLTGADVWAPPLAVADVQPTEQLEATLARARERLPVDRLLAPGCARLVDAALAANAAGMTAAVASLYGIGRGATAPGDDTLLGCLALLEAARHDAAPVLARAVRARLDGTAALGATMLRHAAEGRHAETTTSLALALLEGAPRDVAAALDTLLARSSPGGRATVAGALAGLTIVCAAPDARGGRGMLPPFGR